MKQETKKRNVLFNSDQGAQFTSDTFTGVLKLYNGERPHQALKNQTPDGVHQAATGGGAMMLEKYGAVKELPIALRAMDPPQAIRV